MKWGSHTVQFYIAKVVGFVTVGGFAKVAGFCKGQWFCKAGWFALVFLQSQVTSSRDWSETSKMKLNEFTHSSAPTPWIKHVVSMCDNSRKGHKSPSNHLCKKEFEAYSTAYYRKPILSLVSPRTSSSFSFSISFRST